MPLSIVKRHGSRTWYLRGTVRGISIDKSTRTDNREAAEAIRIKTEQKLLDRSVYGARATVTFLEAAVKYMEGGGEGRFMQPLIDHFKGRKVAEIEQEDIEAAAKAIYPRASASTRNRQVFTPVSAVLQLAARAKWRPHLKLERPTEPKGRIRWLSKEEALRLVENCSPHLKPLVIFLFGTGARLSEALYLQWTNVDLKRGHVDLIDTKNGENRGIPLSATVIAALANIEHRVGPVFLTNTGEPYKPHLKGGGGQIKTAFAGACRRAKIKNFTPHDCRHTFATWHYQANRDIAGLMLLCGWKSEAMALRYAHTNVENLAPSVNAMGW